MNLTHSALCAALGIATSLAIAAGQPIIGLITKTETNPFWVKMKEGAQQSAAANGARLLTAAGKSEGDNAGQVAAIENMVAAGANKALKAAGKDKDVMIVSVDGGCAGVKNVQAGVIAATAQQYPLKMASMGGEAGIAYARTGKKVSGYTDTGVTLITDKPVQGVAARDTKFGLDACWGNR